MHSRLFEWEDPSKETHLFIHGPKRMEHYVRLKVEAISYIQWLAQYVAVRNGVTMMQVVNKSLPQAVLTLDASGHWGCGAYSGPNWFTLRWNGPICE